MIDERDLLEAAARTIAPPRDVMEGLVRRRDRKRRNRRISSAVVAIVVVAAAAVGLVEAFGSERNSQPAHRTPQPASRMHNGAIDVTGFTDGVRALAPDGSVGRFAFKCQGGCTEVPGADWSPDGTRLAFAATCGGGCGSSGDPYHGIHVVDPVTGADRQVTHGEGYGPLEWSPDGTRIAYVQDQQIYVMNADGSHQAPLTASSRDAYPSSPSWSPDGSRIVYSNDKHVFVVGIDGSTPSFLVNGEYPAWSPDGSRIAYLAGCEVRVTTPEGSGSTSLTTLRADPQKVKCDSASDLEWSPDGAKLAAILWKYVFVLRADGSGAHLLSDPNGHYLGFWGLAWQPVP